MSTANCSVEQIISHVAEANKILVASHVSPDADAYGSSLGLTLALQKLGKKVVCLNADGISDRYLFMPGIQQIVNKIDNVKYDLVLVCDCGAANRMGDTIFNTVLTAAPVVINIDHHISNSLFGHLNYVIGNASSTAEIIFQLIEKANWPIDKNSATALLAGIYGDTGGFRYSSTSAETFRIAGALIAAGAVPHVIANELFSRRQVGAFKLQAIVNARAELIAKGKVIYTVVHPEDFKQTNTNSELTEGFVENLRDIDGVEIACFIYWHNDIWKISLRSKSTTINVSNIAQKFGGGGHAQAAAFRFRKTLSELKELLLPELEQAVR